MNEDEKLRRLLAVSRSDAFWGGQRKRILERIEGAKAPRVLWPLAPALAAAAFLVVLQVRKREAPPPEPVPSVSEWGLLQNLDLLEEVDKTLEAKGGRL